jgi:hypothetical protein
MTRAANADWQRAAWQTRGLANTRRGDDHAAEACHLETRSIADARGDAMLTSKEMVYRGATNDRCSHMTTLEQLKLKPEIVRELQSQFIHSVEDLLATAAQPNEREALLEDMKWTEGGLEAVLEEARRVVPAH